MTALPRQFREDKALRDAAKAMLAADVAHFKESIAEEGIAGRLKSQITGKVKRRVSSGAQDLLDQAKEQASDHRGVLALLVGAIILWFARTPILGLLGLREEDEYDDDAEGGVSSDGEEETGCEDDETRRGSVRPQRAETPAHL